MVLYGFIIIRNPMVPNKTDPRWKKLILDENLPLPSALPTKLLLMRVRLMAKDKTPQKIQEAIDIAYDFFIQNTEILKSDVELYFGEKE